VDINFIVRNCISRARGGYLLPAHAFGCYGNDILPPFIIIIIITSVFLWWKHIICGTRGSQTRIEECHQV